MLELLVALTLLGVLLLVARMAMPQAPGVDTREQRTILQVRHEALRSGRAVTAIVMRQGEPLYLTAHPDGRVLTASVGEDGIAAIRASNAH